MYEKYLQTLRLISMDNFQQNVHLESLKKRHIRSARSKVTRGFVVVGCCKVVVHGHYHNSQFIREYVESNALNNWKLKIFKIIDERVLFYYNNLDVLPPKPKLCFRYLKQGIQEFHRKYVLAPAYKAANNVVVV